MLDISVKMLRNWTDKGAIPFVQIGGRRKYTTQDIQDVLDHTPFEFRERNVDRKWAADWGHIYSRTKSGAKLRNIEHTITKEDFQAILRRSKGKCEVSGLPFSNETVSGRAPYAPSIDRIDSSRGYVPGNCRLVCFAVNIALSNWGDDVLRNIARSLVMKERRG